MKHLTILLFLIFAIGCTDRSINGYNSSVYSHPELNNAPSWVRAPNFEGGIAAIGSQKIGASGIDFARKNAIASARDSLASNIQIKVKNLIKNFTESTGIGSGEKVDRVSKHVSTQSTSQLLKGSRHADTWISPSGELYALVVVNLNKAKHTVKETAFSSFKNDSALWQQFKAKQGFQELESEIDKEFGN